MHRIAPHPLWLGHVGDLRDFRLVFETGIQALVDLAVNEPVPLLPRDMACCRFPLVDGAENDPRLLGAAIETAAALLSRGIPTLVYCSAGLSRSPAIAAAAISRITGQSPESCLNNISHLVSYDVSPGLWNDVLRVLHMK